MYGIGTIDDMYGADTAHEIVLRFLTNAGGWRGDTARMLKKELQRRCKDYQKRNKI
jgi:hypothetical protein